MKEKLMRDARRYLYTSTSMRVEVVGGNSAPEWAGESGRYETKGGRRICHPSAYSQNGWSNMVYVSSTLHIVVGADWTC
jgi:hypothetical protein